MLRLRYAGAAVVAVLGCSPVKDSSNVPDAPLDGTDMRPPTITSSVPANMGTKFSVISPLSVYVDEALDPATVTAANVKLTYNPVIPFPYMPTFEILRNHGPITSGPTQIKGTVSYDAVAKKISFVPALPLPYGIAMTLHIDVKDTAGLGLMADINFMTYVNAITRTYNFSSTGVPASWFNQPTDMAGRMNRRVNLINPGGDGQWFNPDDQANQVMLFTYAPDGRIIDERQMLQGPDGNFNTPDDVTNICLAYRYDANRLVTERTYATTPGPDGQFCTMDDPPVINSIYQYMGSTITGWVYNTGSGTDGVWRTPDDRCSQYWDYAYDAMGRMQRDIMRSCGPDSIPRTADDAMLYNWYFDYTYDGAGNLIRSEWVTSSGPDGTYFTPDDGRNEYRRFQYDAAGLVTQTLSSAGPGTDTMWGTNDDPGSRLDTVYNAQKLPIESTTYSFGPDSMWNTPDDVITLYSKGTYDANGNKIDIKNYNAGADGIWKNDDDKVITDFDFDAAH
jgi:hypothetical protein